MNKPVVVIGGGIVGASVALHLLDREIPTVLVERDDVPQGASAFSFASISAFDEPSRDAYLLKAYGMVTWHRFADRLEGDIGLKWSGEVRWTETEQSGADLRRNMERARRRGYPVRPLSERELRELLPSSRPGPVTAACFGSEDGQVDALRAVIAVREAFEKSGGTLLVGRAGLHFEGLGTEVKVGNHDIDAAAVVVAAGAETVELSERLGWEIPLDASPGFLVLTSPVDPVITETVYVSPPSGPPVHLRQLDNGRVLIGEGVQTHVVRNPGMRHARLLLRQATHVFPALLGAEVERFTVEWRPMPRDHVPILGPVPGIPSVYIAATHAGVTLAPAVGEFVAQEIAEGPLARLEPFRPQRFAAHGADAAVSVEEVFGSAPGLYLG